MQVSERFMPQLPNRRRRFGTDADYFLLYFFIGVYSLGLARWEKAREQWLAHKSDTDSTSKAAVPLEVDEIIDVIFNPRWRNAGEEDGPPRRFPQNVPLPQMVDVLVDLWEAEGLDT